MKGLHIYVSVMLVACIISCIKKKDDEGLTLQKTPYLGKELRTDGYFYSNEPYDSSARIFILYKNGIVLYPGSNAHPDTYIADFAKNHNRDIKRFWGLFAVDSIQKTIKIEYYKPKIFSNEIAMTRSGNILNDSTFIIKEIRRSKDGSELSLVNEVYHFKPYCPKPDSTNNFL